MISFQTYVGSAFSSHPVRWIEPPEAARSQYGIDKTAGNTVEKTVDLDLGKPQSQSGDVLDLSQGTQRTLALGQSDSRVTLKNSTANAGKTDTPAVKSNSVLPTGVELTPEEQQQVDKLKARDQEVRTHESAHMMAAGAYVTSGPSYTYQTGPDGKGYAIGGSVGIDTSPIEGDPEATIQKMQTVAAAALAPAEPSGQDQKVAAAARQAEAKARAELVQLRTEQQKSEIPPESEEGVAAEFSVVRTADKMANASDVAESVMPSLVRAQESSPSSAYKAHSLMTLVSSRFSAFA